MSQVLPADPVDSTDPVESSVAHDVSSDDAVRRRVVEAVEHRALRTVLQPVVHLDTGFVIGVEALTRFPDGPSPAEWFTDAARVGLGPTLELAAAAVAVECLDGLPRGVHLSVNASVATVVLADFEQLLADQEPGRLVVELTCSPGGTWLDEVVAAVERITALGAQVALDDVGGALLDLHEAVGVRPHILKLDRDVVRGLDDPRGRTDAAALVAVARDLGVFTVAKGVETDSQLRALVEVGVDAVQGNLLAPADDPPLRVVSVAVR